MTDAREMVSAVRRSLLYTMEHTRALLVHAVLGQEDGVLDYQDAPSALLFVCPGTYV